jgi:hypothetical protein
MGGHNSLIKSYPIQKIQVSQTTKLSHILNIVLKVQIITDIEEKATMDWV